VKDAVAEGKSFIDRCVSFMEKDTRGIQIVTYGVTSVGLLVALYRIRPFAKFTKPSDVPTRFVKMRVPLQGTAVRIEPRHGALIMVDHKPLVDLPRFGAAKQLSVKVAGVDVTNHGISWLQTVVGGKQIEFIPIARKTDYLDCTINVKDTEETTLSIGEELVRLGFGTIGKLEPEPSIDQKILQYKAALNCAQKQAKIERNGHWHFTINPTYLWRLRYLLHTNLSRALPTRMSKQLSI